MIPLREAYKYGIEKIGGKAYYLSLASKYVKVPEGFVLTTDYFDTWKKIKKIEVPIEKFDRNKTYIVRSSANLEDYKRFSFAGIFESVLYVKRDEIPKAIEKVYQSVYSERVKRYCKNLGINLETIKMAIIVQEMITEGKYGVLFSYNNYKVIQAGLYPTSVTSGRGIIDTYVIRNNEIYKYPSLDVIILFDDEIRNLAQMSKNLEEIIKEHDLEWAIDIDENFWLLQIRPITKKFKIGSLTQYGFPASPGKARGRVVKYKKEYGKDKIAIAVEIPIDEVDDVKKYGGIILEVPGLLSHAAIVAREYGIPCIVGVPISIFKEDELIEIDGNTGKIKFLDRKSPEIRIKREKIEFYPDKLRLFLINKTAYIIYDWDMEKQVIYNPGNVNLDILKKIQKVTGKISLDGGVDRWYIYSIPLEMMELKYIDKKELREIYDIIKSDDTKKFLMKYKEYIKKAIEYFKKGYRENDLINKLTYYDISFAYWRLSQGIMLYDLAESANEKIKDLCLKLENDKKARKLINELEKEIGNVIDRIEKSYEISYKDYYSEIEFIEDVKNKIGGLQKG